MSDDSTSLDLDAIERRSQRTHDPGLLRGEKMRAIEESAQDVPTLLAEVKRLRNTTADALDLRLRALEVCRGDSGGRNRGEQHIFGGPPRDAVCVYCGVPRGWSR
jgi:hypothetical protein